MAEEVVKTEPEQEAPTPVVAPTGVELQKIRSFQDLVKGSWRIFRRVWKKYLVFYLAGTLLSAAYVLIAFGVDAFVAYFESGAQGLDPTTFGDFNVLALLGLLLLIPLSIAIQVASYRSVFMQGESAEESVVDTAKYGFKNLLPFFGISLLFGLMVFGGSLLLIVPGVILALMYSAYCSVFVVEGKRGWEVFKRSAEVTKGYKLSILGKYLLAFVAYVVVSFLVGLIGGFFVEIPVVGAGLSALLSQALAFVLSPIMIAYGYLMYKDMATGR